MNTIEKQNRKRFTKIVATVSGKDCTKELLSKLYRSGMDVVRLNTAHMSAEEMEKIMSFAREISPRLAVMLDTKGPNIRTCNVPDAGISLKQGDVVRLSGVPADDGRIAVNYAPFAAEVPEGSLIVCDDGAAKFRVTGKTADALQCEVLFDCTVLNRKSVNVPDVPLKAPALTDKDRMFLAEAVRLKCDFIAHSFVRNAEDVAEVRRALGEAGKDIGIIAKIENREGVRNIQEILNAADGIMVARGDLGIEIPLEEVPVIQKKLIHEARKHAKPVITATQMLQSMENAPAPTRAEVSDVANAVYDGTDAVMLSGETAHGHFPVESVEMMRRIVVEAERAPKEFFPQLDDTPEGDKTAAYLLASAAMSEQFLPVKAIFCSSLNGQSARVCSAMRPRIPIYVLTPYEISMRKLALSYGAFAELSQYDESPIRQIQQTRHLMLDVDHGFADDDLVVVLGKSTDRIRRNNLMALATIRELREQ